MDLTRLFWFLCNPNLKLVLKWNVNSKLHFCFISSFICYCYKILKKNPRQLNGFKFDIQTNGLRMKRFSMYTLKKKIWLQTSQTCIYLVSFKLWHNLFGHHLWQFKKKFNDKNRNQIRLFVYLMFHKRIHSQMFIP